MTITIESRGIELDLGEIMHMLTEAREKGDVVSVERLERELSSWRAVIKEEAYRKAEKINEYIGVRDALTCEINCLSWYIDDLEDAGDDEGYMQELRSLRNEWPGATDEMRWCGKAKLTESGTSRR